MNPRSSHNTFILNTKSSVEVTLDSNFDSGNLQSAQILDQSSSGPQIKIQLMPALDPFHGQYSTRQSTKTFFHFNCEVSQDCILHLSIGRANILNIIQGQFDRIYRICVGKLQSKFQLPVYQKQKPQFIKLKKNIDDCFLEFKYEIKKGQKTYFAYHFPYPFERLSRFLQSLQLKYSEKNLGQKNIYYRNQVLIESIEGRPINLLTITEQPSFSQKQNLLREPRISRSLFPHHHMEERAYKFQKPYILVTCRVHPGETSASFALEGFINKILDNSDESVLLRKNFVFIIVPMINPDGVFHGTYRMDTLGHNLNRFYNCCVTHKQPSIFAINSLMHHHSQSMLAYFDFHSHPQGKGSFVYGNSYTSFQQQVQSQLFAKLLSKNQSYFNYGNCSFSEKNMTAKDINDVLSKDGSGRVAAYKKMSYFSPVHCYGVEFGYHGFQIKTMNQNGIRGSLKQSNDQKNNPITLSSTSQERNQNNINVHNSQKTNVQKNIQIFTIDNYKQDGSIIVETIFQIYVHSVRMCKNGDKNGDKGEIDPVHTLREEIAKQIYEKQDRFKNLDGGALKKLKNIHNTVYQSFYSKIFKKYPFFEYNIREYERKKLKSKEQFKMSLTLLRQNRRKSKIQSLDSVKTKGLNGAIQAKTLTQRSFSRNLTNSRCGVIMKSGRKDKDKTLSKQGDLKIESEQNLPSNRRYQEQLQLQIQTGIQMQTLPQIANKKLNFLPEYYKKRVASYNQVRGGQSLTKGLLRNISYKCQTTERSFACMQQKAYQCHIIKQGRNKHEKLFFEALSNYESTINPEMNPRMMTLKNQYNARLAQRVKERKQIDKQLKSFEKTEQLEKNSILTSTKADTLRMRKVARSKRGLPITERNNQYEFELKMRQKYDRQYKISHYLKSQRKCKEKMILL